MTHTDARFQRLRERNSLVGGDGCALLGFAEATFRSVGGVGRTHHEADQECDP
jgi:hypothetical protein